MTTTASKLDASSHVSEFHHLVRERAFSASADLLGVLRVLRESSATGTLMLDIHKGGVGSVRFREEQEVSFEK